ncbi:hypothetical protein FA13DRAFT_503050 [Coprinellus micaceus]|uniref:Uncharacterized protein n=1 Tax=Coprinellus micaceus TaxID=71717 RepID=A0A4Y7TBH3_COPMI|nr:hypothetical protein FA13DRAFT_503050 [Coprinellus micaceus]
MKGQKMTGVYANWRLSLVKVVMFATIYLLSCQTQLKSPSAELHSGLVPVQVSLLDRTADVLVHRPHSRLRRSARSCMAPTTQCSPVRTPLLHRGQLSNFRLFHRGFHRNLYISTTSPFKNQRNWEDSIQRNGMLLFNPLRFGFGVGYYLFMSLTWPLTSIGYGYASGSPPFFDKSLCQGPSHLERMKEEAGAWQGLFLPWRQERFVGAAPASCLPWKVFSCRIG